MSPPAPFGDVLVVGDVMVDLVITHTGPVAVDSDTPSRIRPGGGGSAANTACWLGHLGVPVRLLAAVGDDAWSQWVSDDLHASGVALVGPILSDAVTGTCAVLVGPDGERTMFPDRGANDQMAAEHVPTAFAPVPGWVHLSGYTLLGQGSRDAGRAVMDAARDAACPVSVDASSTGPLLAVGPDRFLSWIEGAAVVFANGMELAALGGEEAVLAHADALVIKHGARGATWTDGNRRLTTPGVRVDLVDSTGAGDAFAAGWIAARGQGLDEQDALDAGAVTGAQAVTAPGARP
ncbi:MAG: sugar kinase [Aquihabitans sp.]